MYLCNVSQTGDMKKLATLLKLSFIVVGWIVFILLSYVAFKDEKTNVLITMKDSYPTGQPVCDDKDYPCQS